MNIHQFFQSVSEKLHESANVEKVYGKPITSEGRTIIPVAKIAYGFGGGFGSGEHNKEEGSGGGGGGGVAASPVGLVEITGEKTRFISVNQKKKLVGAAVFGMLFGIFIGKKLLGNKKPEEQNRGGEGND